MQLTLKTILNLKEMDSHFVCDDIRLTRGKEPRIAVKVEPRRGCKGFCSGCGEARPGYDRLPRREFTHVPIWGIGVIFLYCMRRLNLSQVRRDRRGRSMEQQQEPADDKLCLAFERMGQAVEHARSRAAV
jgi:hypothetical protein